jgi:hypothetical protein
VAALCETWDVVFEGDDKAVLVQPDLVDLDVGRDVCRGKVLLSRGGIRTLDASAAITQGDGI